MGTFGHTAFENDAALDCVDELIAAKKPTDLIKSVTQQVNSSSDRDAVDCSRVIAIAEAIAITRGNPPRSYSDELKDWVIESGYVPPQTIVTSLRETCRLILEDSELRDLWYNDRGWRDSVKRTIKRLESKPKIIKRASPQSPSGRRTSSWGKTKSQEQLSSKQLGKKIKTLGGYYEASDSKPYRASVSDKKNSNALIQAIGQLRELSCLRLDYGKLTGLDTRPLAQLTNLIELNAKDARIADGQLAFLQNLKKLKRIEFESSGPKANVRLGDASLEHIKHCTHCRSLNLRDCHVTDKGLKHLAPLSELVAIDLSATRIKGNGLRWLQSQKLRNVGLGDCKLSGAGLRTLGDFASLRHLDLRRSNLAGISLRPLAELQEIEYLNLEFSGIGERSFKQLLSQLPWPNLQQLKLDKTVVSDRILPGLGDCPKLKELFLAETKIKGIGLGNLNRLKKLDRLDLRDSPITDDGIAELRCPQLTWLSLENSKVTNRCIKHLAKLKKLKALFLGGTRVNDEMISDLTSIKSLTHIGLGKTAITAKGIQGLFGHPKLYMLTVSFQVYSAALEQTLRKKCPEFGLLSPS